MLSEGAGQTEQKKYTVLIRQAGKHDRHQKKSKGWGSQHFPTEGTENTQHRGAFSLIDTVSDAPSSPAGEEREAARTCSGKKQKFTARTEEKKKKDSEQSSKLKSCAKNPCSGCQILLGPNCSLVGGAEKERHQRHRRQESRERETATGKPFSTLPAPRCSDPLTSLGSPSGKAGSGPPTAPGRHQVDVLSLVGLNFLHNMALKDMENFDVEVRNLGIVVLAFRAENFGKAGSLRSPYLCRKQG